MSWVAAQNAVKTAQTAMRVTLARGSLREVQQPEKIPAWARSIQLRRRPSVRGWSSGKLQAITTGAHRNFRV
jgi:hypothetical protein